MRPGDVHSLPIEVRTVIAFPLCEATRNNRQRNEARTPSHKNPLCQMMGPYVYYEQINYTLWDIVIITPNTHFLRGLIAQCSLVVTGYTGLAVAFSTVIGPPRE